MAEEEAVPDLEYNLPRELDLLAAEDLREVLLGYLHRDCHLKINADEVERVSTPCIEILYSAGLSFERGNRRFQIHNSSPYFNNALNILGLEGHFQRWRLS